MDRRRLALAGLWSATLAVSAVLYTTEHALEHFLWHLSYGGAFGLLLGAAWMLYRSQPTRHASLWAWAGYAYMIVPDLIWLWPRLRGRAVHPHEPWMDVFLGHVALDTWAWTNWLLVPTVAAGVIAFRWVARRVGEGHGSAKPALENGETG